jgi:small-conductance mechanosensitive channel
MISDLDLDWLPVFDIAASLALILLLLLTRLIAGHAIRRRTKAAVHLQRRWTTNIRTLLVFLGVIGLVLIWAPQLRTFALSLTAVAVAVVVATKELILCFSGSFLRAASRTYSVGDWIEVAGIRGEVVDHNVFVTTLHEFEPETFSFTGRTTVIPNSVFVAQPMRNDSLMRDFTHHSFALTLDTAVDIFAERGAIESIVTRQHASLTREAAAAKAAAQKRSGLVLPEDQVRVNFGTSDLGKYRIEVSLFCPTPMAEALENEITCEVMSYLHDVARRQRLEEEAQQAHVAGTEGDGAGGPT